MLIQSLDEKGLFLFWLLVKLTVNMATPFTKSSGHSANTHSSAWFVVDWHYPDILGFCSSHLLSQIQLSPLPVTFLVGLFGYSCKFKKLNLIFFVYHKMNNLHFIFTSFALSPQTCFNLPCLALWDNLPTTPSSRPCLLFPARDNVSPRGAMWYSGPGPTPTH